MKMKYQKMHSVSDFKTMTLFMTEAHSSVLFAFWLKVLTGPYPDPDESDHNTATYLLRSHFIIIFPSLL
jgi:hypothetical protein